MKTIAIGLLACIGLATAGEEKKVDLSWKGDVRLRHEETYKTDDTRKRDRIRLRLGAKAELPAGFEANLKVATGEGDPVSTNQTNTDAFSGKMLNLDQAFLTWKMEGLTLLGGKMSNPFQMPHKKGEMIWDGDINPEGYAASYEVAGLTVTAANFNLSEISKEKDGDDQYLQAAQLVYKLDLDVVNFTLGASDYYFNTLRGRELVYGDKARGNSLDKDGNYSNNYSVLEGWLDVGFKVAGIPALVSGAYVNNIEADKENQGFLGAITLGKVKKALDWSLGYQYRQMEADAVVSALTSSDLAGQSTDSRAHIAKASVGLASGVSANVAYYFLNSTGLAKDEVVGEHSKVQVDLVAKF